MIYKSKHAWHLNPPPPPMNPLPRPPERMFGTPRPRIPSNMRRLSTQNPQSPLPLPIPPIIGDCPRNIRESHHPFPPRSLCSLRLYTQCPRSFRGSLPLRQPAIVLATLVFGDDFQCIWCLFQRILCVFRLFERLF